MDPRLGERFSDGTWWDAVESILQALWGGAEGGWTGRGQEWGAPEAVVYARNDRMPDYLLEEIGMLGLGAVLASIWLPGVLVMQAQHSQRPAQRVWMNCRSGEFSRGSDTPQPPR